MAPPADVDRARPGGALASPAVVALASWLVPGGGYWLLGHRARAVTVGVTIAALFVFGILIGGVRAIQVPGYGENGGALYVVGKPEQQRDNRDRTVTVYRVVEHAPDEADPPSDKPVVTSVGALLGEIGNKPWSICQVMAGPLAIAGGTGSVWASRPAGAGEDDDEQPAPARGELSHSRANEIAVLYTAVAGMLNLLVIIDAAARASRRTHGIREAAA